MNLVQLTPGAGPMYCGGCLRDNALVAALRRQGHEALMVPLYLPLTLDEADEAAGTPIFFGGIKVFLEQKSAIFRGAPGWLRDLLDARPLLKLAAGKAAGTRPIDVGDLTLSMLRGEEGNQSRALAELIQWLRTQPRPDVVCLSNALLVGMARKLKADLGVPVVCTLQGEDFFLDGLPSTHRQECWRTLASRAAEVDLFIAPSRYFGDLMRERLGLRPEQVRVVPNGIHLAGYPTPGTAAPDRRSRPVVGFFARMCPEKGLDTLVEAFIALRRRGRAGEVKLRVGGSCGPADRAFVEEQRGRLAAAGLEKEVEVLPNPDRAAKIEFLRSLSVVSVPARCGEAFGLYVIEAMAAGVPVVQPQVAAFPEVLEVTGGGITCAANDSQALAEKLEELLLDPQRAQALGEAGQRAVFEKFSAEEMARATIAAVADVVPMAR